MLSFGLIPTDHEAAGDTGCKEKVRICGIKDRIVSLKGMNHCTMLKGLILDSHVSFLVSKSYR